MASKTFFAITTAVALLMFIASASAQRPTYAGSRPPSGYKDKFRPTVNPMQIGERVGEDEVSSVTGSQRPPVGVEVVTPQENYMPLPNRATQTQDQPSAVASRVDTIDNSSGQQSTSSSSPLPLDAHGDQQLVNQLLALPVDKRPFWLLNYQAIEAHRNGSGGNLGGPVASTGTFFG